MTSGDVFFDNLFLGAFDLDSEIATEYEAFSELYDSEEELMEDMDDDYDDNEDSWLF